MLLEYLMNALSVASQISAVICAVIALKDAVTKKK